MHLMINGKMTFLATAMRFTAQTGAPTFWQIASYIPTRLYSMWWAG